MIRAVLFDLYDTLIYRDMAVTRQSRAALARRAGLAWETLAAVWRRRVDDLMSGRLGRTIEEELGTILKEAGAQVDEEVLAALAQMERKNWRRAVEVYPNTRRTLWALRRRGFKLGLVSNCSHLAATPLHSLGLAKYFDALALSHEAGFLKPDQRLYLKACQDLGVRPVECVYVADGSFGELDAAHALGMHAVRIVQDRQSRDYGHSDYWDWQIRDIRELLIYPLLTGPSAAR